MRIVSWNMNHARRSPAERAGAWNYLRNVLRADIALVQEASPPDDLRNRTYRPIDETNRHYRWGSAVVGLNTDFEVKARPRKPLPDCYMTPPTGDELPDSHPGACAVADILNGSGEKLFTAVSLYGQWETMADGRNIYSCARVHRMLSDLTGVLAKSRRHPVVLAGDLNLTTQVAFEGQKDVDTAGAQAAFDRIRAWGMVDCIAESADAKSLQDCSCSDGDRCRHARTFRLQNKPDSRPTQLDYAFVSRSLMPRVKGPRVVDEDAAWALSDHCPIALDLDI